MLLPPSATATVVTATAAATITVAVAVAVAVALMMIGGPLKETVGIACRVGRRIGELVGECTFILA